MPPDTNNTDEGTTNLTGTNSESTSQAPSTGTANRSSSRQVTTGNSRTETRSGRTGSGRVRERSSGAFEDLLLDKLQALTRAHQADRDQLQTQIGALTRRLEHTEAQTQQPDPGLSAQVAELGRRTEILQAGQAQLVANQEQLAGYLRSLDHGLTEFLGSLGGQTQTLLELCSSLQTRTAALEELSASNSASVESSARALESLLGQVLSLAGSVAALNNSQQDNKARES
jgi:hypothetical protein